MRVARIVAPITSLGPGKRVGVWVQGCDLECPGCASQDTWDPDGGAEVAPEHVAATLIQQAEDHAARGVSVTGGEPLQQPSEMADVLTIVRSVRPALDVILFTGYGIQVAERRAPEVLEQCDVVVAGRYMRDRPSDHPLLGSANQVMSARTDSGQDLLAWVDESRRVSLTASAQDLFFVGLPAPGDLGAFRDQLRERGVEFEGTTWT